MNSIHIPEDVVIGKWGRLRQEYMMSEQPSFYQTLVDKNTLEKYLKEIEAQAEKRMDFLTNELRRELDISNELKEAPVMNQITKMHNIVLIAEEIVLNELIYI